MTLPFLVDSHCHLDFPDFAAERDDVIVRARNAGVGTMVTICTKISELAAVRAIADAHDEIWCTVGIHPHEAASEPATDAATLSAHARHAKVVGIGECGLDFYYDHSPRERQEAVFRTHAAAARDSSLPLIVHTRDADVATAAILTEEAGKGPLTGVLHCFSSGPELADIALDLGFYVSFSGIVTFKSAAALREIARRVPADRILVETDAPYLAPVPKRGKRNEPSFVVHTASLLAELRGVAVETLAQQTTANFFRLFAKARRPISSDKAGDKAGDEAGT
jgi:TatD DNase family protein